MGESVTKQDDIKVDFIYSHGPLKTFNWSQSGEPAMSQWKIFYVISAPTTYVERSYKIADVDFHNTVSALLVYDCDIFHQNTWLEKAKT